MSWQSDAATGAAQHLSDQGVGIWDPNGTTGNIYRGALPADVVPGIGVQTYRVGADDPIAPTARLRIQFWLVAGSDGALDDLDAAIYDAMQGLTDAQWGDAHVTDCGSVSAIPQGVDGDGNPQRACNYQLDLDLPATALRSY